VADGGEDKNLLEAARKGDRAAFRGLVEKYQRRAYAVALGVLHNPDDAKDVCQEAFLKAYSNLASFDGSAQFFTWLYRIVMNLAIDVLRKQRGERIELDESSMPAEPDEGGVAPRRLGFDPHRALTDKELRAQLLAALAELHPMHREVLVLREVEGLSYQQMAETIGVSIGTVMSRLFHARRKMQKILAAAKAAA
jgi:RNA polymerase sigma-70 factor (ECF subfamily)